MYSVCVIHRGQRTTCRSRLLFPPGSLTITAREKRVLRAEQSPNTPDRRRLCAFSLNDAKATEILGAGWEYCCLLRTGWPIFTATRVLICQNMPFLGAEHFSHWLHRAAINLVCPSVRGSTLSEASRGHWIPEWTQVPCRRHSALSRWELFSAPRGLWDGFPKAPRLEVTLSCEVERSKRLG